MSKDEPSTIEPTLYVTIAGKRWKITEKSAAIDVSLPMDGCIAWQTVIDGKCIGGPCEIETFEKAVQYRAALLHALRTMGALP